MNTFTPRRTVFYDNSVRIPNTGEIVLDSTTAETRERNRSLILMGIGAAYSLKEKLELYANFSQNYRAITFNNIRVVNPSAAVDENLQDERGFNLDLGLRGQISKAITLDASLFWLSYQDRIGTVLTLIQDEFFGERLVQFTTNVADAEILGLEFYAETDLKKMLKWESKLELNLFGNTALIHAFYHDAKSTAVEGNRVESVPLMNFKTGLQSRWKNIGSSLQFSYLSQQFSEATNAEISPTGIFGEIPAYWVMDFSLDYKWKFITAEAGVNNLTDESYFTRRAAGYPGPGIIPAAPRSYYIGVEFQF